MRGVRSIGGQQQAQHTRLEQHGGSLGGSDTLLNHGRVIHRRRGTEVLLDISVEGRQAANGSRRRRNEIAHATDERLLHLGWAAEERLALLVTAIDSLLELCDRLVQRRNGVAQPLVELPCAGGVVAMCLDLERQLRHHLREVRHRLRAHERRIRGTGCCSSVASIRAAAAAATDANARARELRVAGFGIDRTLTLQQGRELVRASVPSHHERVDVDRIAGFELAAWRHA